MRGVPDIKRVLRKWPECSQRSRLKSIRLEIRYSLCESSVRLRLT